MSLAKPWPHPGHRAPHQCQQEGQGCDTAVSAVTSLQAAGWDRLLGDHQPCSWHGGKPALCAYRLNCLILGSLSFPGELGMVSRVSRCVFWALFPFLWILWEVTGVFWQARGAGCAGSCTGSQGCSELRADRLLS